MLTTNSTYKFFSFEFFYFRIALDIWLVPYPYGYLTLYGLMGCK